MRSSFTWHSPCSKEGHISGSRNTFVCAAEELDFQGQQLTRGQLLLTTFNDQVSSNFKLSCTLCIHCPAPIKRSNTSSTATESAESKDDKQPSLSDEVTPPLAARLQQRAPPSRAGAVPVAAAVTSRKSLADASIFKLTPLLPARLLTHTAQHASAAAAAAAAASRPKTMLGKRSSNRSLLAAADNADDDADLQSQPEQDEEEAEDQEGCVDDGEEAGAVGYPDQGAGVRVIAGTILELLQGDDQDDAAGGELLVNTMVQIAKRKKERVSAQQANVLKVGSFTFCEPQGTRVDTQILQA